MKKDENLTRLEQQLLYFIPRGGSRITYDQGTLAAVFNVDARKVREVVHSLRRKGYPVLFHAKGGYYLPDASDPDDVIRASRFVDTMRAQATARLESCKPVERWLQETVQISIEDYWRQDG